MKSIILLIASLFCFITVTLGQKTNYPKGAYMSFKEIIDKSPSNMVELELIKRTNGDIKMTGGNDFKLLKSDKSIPKKTIKKEYYAYSDGDSLYINCFHYKVQFWYTPVLSDGKFLVIRAGISMNVSTQKEQLNNKAQLGYMFGPVGGAIQGAKLAMLRFLYIIDKESNELTPVTGDYLKQLLSEYPDLLTQFENEDQKLNQVTFLKYLKLLNKTS